MQSEMKRTIINLIKASDEKAITVNRVFRRLIGEHKTNIKQAMKSLIKEGRVVMRVATGEAAIRLEVQNGTEVYILNK
jgi:ferritin-like metal-binding protein YciE